MEESLSRMTLYILITSILTVNLGDSQPRRLLSPVLANFPWYSTVVSSCEDLCEVVDIKFDCQV